MLDEEPTPRDLVRFHTTHKLNLMAHTNEHYYKMGRLQLRFSILTPELPGCIIYVCWRLRLRLVPL
jgi:hypothetical protein